MPQLPTEKHSFREQAKEIRANAKRSALEKESEWGEGHLTRLFKEIPNSSGRRLILSTIPIGSELRLAPFSWLYQPTLYSYTHKNQNDHWLFPAVEKQDLLWFPLSESSNEDQLNGKEKRLEKSKALSVLESPDAKPIEHFLGCCESVLVLAPALATNLAGFRLGYGGGYYDRFLETLFQKHGAREKTVVATCVLESLSKLKFKEEKHDVPVDLIVTELQTTFVSPQNQVLSRLGK